VPENAYGSVTFGGSGDQTSELYDFLAVRTARLFPLVV
jgi:hypothetical protein